MNAYCPLWSFARFEVCRDLQFLRTGQLQSDIVKIAVLAEWSCLMELPLKNSGKIASGMVTKGDTHQFEISSPVDTLFRFAFYIVQRYLV